MMLRVPLDWIRAARKKYTNRNYQLWLGDVEVKILEKEKGGTYLLLPLAAFTEDADKNFQELLGLTIEREEKVLATCRGQDKRGNSSPSHSMDRMAQSRRQR